MDSYTDGAMVNIGLHSMIGDVTYYTVAIYGANKLGITEWPMIVPGNSIWAEALRYGMLAGGLLTLRKFLESAGIRTNVYYYLQQLFSMSMY